MDFSEPHVNAAIDAYTKAGERTSLTDKLLFAILAKLSMIDAKLDEALNEDEGE